MGARVGGRQGARALRQGVIFLRFVFVRARVCVCARAGARASVCVGVRVLLPRVCRRGHCPSWKYSATGTRARVARVRAEYPNQLDYSGFWEMLHQNAILMGFSDSHVSPSSQAFTHMRRRARCAARCGTFSLCCAAPRSAPQTCLSRKFYRCS